MFEYAIYIKIDGFYRYYAGNYGSYESAEEAIDFFRTNGYNHIYIIVKEQV